MNDMLWDEILNFLIGTTHNVNVALEKCTALSLINDKEFRDYLDSTIFQCEGCHTWYDNWDLSDVDNICHSCVDKN